MRPLTLSHRTQNKQKQTVLLNIYADGQMIKRVDEFKYLNDALDPTLTFKNHINKMQNLHVLGTRYQLKLLKHT